MCDVATNVDEVVFRPPKFPVLEKLNESSELGMTADDYLLID